jgi:hypothetical protein
MTSSHKVAEWRKGTKEKLIAGFGGKCNKCGYSNCSASLDLHHLDPSKKSFGFGKAMANPIKWNLLVEEAEKCILLCRNCHGEYHAGYWSLDQIEIVKFQGEKTIFAKDTATGNCATCGKEVFMHRICCSRECAAVRANKINWPSKEDFCKMLQENSRTKVAKLLGVSDTAVKRRQIKLGYIPR